MREQFEVIAAAASELEDANVAAVHAEILVRQVAEFEARVEAARALQRRFHPGRGFMPPADPVVTAEHPTANAYQFMRSIGRLIGTALGPSLAAHTAFVQGVRDAVHQEHQLTGEAFVEQWTRLVEKHLPAVERLPPVA